MDSGCLRPGNATELIRGSSTVASLCVFQNLSENVFRRTPVNVYHQLAILAPVKMF